LAVKDIAAKRPEWTIPEWLQGLLALGSAIGLVALLLLGLALTRSSLTVVMDGHRFQVRTHARTVGSALRQAGFELHPEDRISLEPDAPLQPGTEVQIERAEPVWLSVGGQTQQLRTHATTVGGFLADAGVQTRPADEIRLDGQMVDLDTPLNSGTLHPAQAGQPGGQQLASGDSSSESPQVSVLRAWSITLDDNGVATTLHTTASTVGQALQEHGLTLFLGDEVLPDLQSSVESGMTVTIHRSVPVRIDVDGHTILTRTRAENVAGVLGQEGIALVGRDSVEPPTSDPIQPDMTIRVTRVREELIVEFDPIPFETVWVADPDVEIDNIRLVQEGQLGITKRRYRVTFHDGHEVERVIEDVWAEQPPMDKTMAYGTKIVVRTMDTPDGPIEYWRTMRVYTTSYKPASCGKPKDHPRYGYTALGLKLTIGIVAVDPDVIPLKSRMYVPGYGHARAGDTGGGVKGKLVDLGYEDHNYQSWHWWSDIYLTTPVPPREKIRWVLPDWPRYPDRKRR
jgi:uncharacterized protein YabE (DUF348 family)